MTTRKQHHARAVARALIIKLYRESKKPLDAKAARRYAELKRMMQVH